MAAFDRDAARKARGGKFIGDIADALPPAGLPGLRGGGRHEGPRTSTSSTNPSGDMAVGHEVHEGGRLPVGQVRGQRRAPASSAPTPTRARPRPRSPRPSSRSSASRSSSATVPQDAVYTEWCQVPQEEGRRSAPTPAGSRTSPTRSRCSSRRSRARTSPPAAATTTCRSSTTRRSTPRWTRPRCSRATSASRRGRDIDKMITGDAAGRPVHLGQDDARSGPRTSTGSATPYSTPLGPLVHLAQVATVTPVAAAAPPPRRAGAAGTASPNHHGPLHHPPSALDRPAAVGHHRDHLPHLLRAADGRPGRAARRPRAEPGR